MSNNVSELYFYKSATRAAVIGSVLTVFFVIMAAAGRNTQFIVFAFLGPLVMVLGLFLVLLVPVGLYQLIMAYARRGVLASRQKDYLYLSTLALLAQAIVLLLYFMMER